MNSIKNSWQNEAQEFLVKIWSRHKRSGYAFLATRDRATDRWREYPIRLPDVSGLAALLEHLDRTKCDIYFCPNAFRKPRRLNIYSLPTPFAWSDIDAGRYDNCTPFPSIVIRTSPRRFQALWLWHTIEEPDKAESYSRSLTDMAVGDRNGWSITKYLRVPGTFNLKPEYQRPTVRVDHEEWRPLRSRPVELKSKFQPMPLAEVAARGPNTSMDVSSILARYLRQLHPRTRVLLRDKIAFEPDRSKCVYEIVIGLHELGATIPEIMAVLHPNVYFREKYGDTPAVLRREVTRIVAKIERRS